MTKDWKKIARASGLAASDADLERIAAPLDALEADFRRLVRALPDDAWPAPVFNPAVESGE